MNRAGNADKSVPQLRPVLFPMPRVHESGQVQLALIAACGRAKEPAQDAKIITRLLDKPGIGGVSQAEVAYRVDCWRQRCLEAMSEPILPNMGRIHRQWAHTLRL